MCRRKMETIWSFAKYSLNVLCRPSSAGIRLEMTKAAGCLSTQRVEKSKIKVEFLAGVVHKQQIRGRSPDYPPSSLSFFLLWFWAKYLHYIYFTLCYQYFKKEAKYLHYINLHYYLINIFINTLKKKRNTFITFNLHYLTIKSCNVP